MTTATAPIARVDWQNVAVLSLTITVVSLICSAAVAYKVLGPFTVAGYTISLPRWWWFVFNYKGGCLQFFTDAPWRPTLSVAGPLLISASAGLVAFFSMAKPTRPEIHHQGGQLRHGAGAAKAASAAEAKRSPVDFNLAGVPITRDRFRRSTVIFGSPGGGKTQLIWNLILPAAKAGYRMLIVDGPKGDYSSALPTDNMLIVSPWHRGPAWDIAADCPTRNHARELARALIPVSDKDPLWGNAAGMIFVACVCKLQAEHGKAWGWGGLLDLIMLPLDQLKQIAQDYYPPAVQAVADAESKTTQSIAINLTAFMQDVYEMALAWRDETNRFSFCDWWRAEPGKGPQFVIIQGSGEFSSLAGGYISSVIRMIAALTASPSLPDSPDRKNLLIVDELAQLPKLEFIGKFMEIGRSKGCPCILATQTPAQLHKIYGEEDLQAWMSMAGTRCYVRTSGAADLDFVMRELGQKLVYVPTSTRTVSAGGEAVSHGFTQETQPVVTSDFIQNLGPTPDLKIRFLLQGFGADPIALAVPILTRLKPCRPAFLPNPRFNAPAPASLCSNVVETQSRPDAAMVPDVSFSAANPTPQPAPTPPIATAPDPATIAAMDQELSEFFACAQEPASVPATLGNQDDADDAAALDDILAELEALRAGSDNS